MTVTYQYANADKSQAVRTDDSTGSQTIMFWHPAADHPLAEYAFNLWNSDGKPVPAAFAASEALTKLLQEAGVR